jgi:3-methyladenine DNA glycosylase AlkD
MEKYMKNNFCFLGVKSPARNKVFRDLWTQVKPMSVADQFSWVEDLWKEPEREFQYLGLDTLKRIYKKIPLAFLPRLEKLILQKSWWDTVDLLAVRNIGYLLLHNPKLRKPKSREWIDSEKLWLQRTALLFQLSFKNSTDTNLLAENISLLAANKNFFLRKGAGWALREYSKTDPKWVKEFIDKNSILSNLTVREGSKYL